MQKATGMPNASCRKSMKQSLDSGGTQQSSHDDVGIVADSFNTLGSQNSVNLSRSYEMVSFPAF
jgi:hypothetical protein